MSHLCQTTLWQYSTITKCHEAKAAQNEMAPVKLGSAADA